MADKQTIAVYDAQVELYRECIEQELSDPTLQGFIAQVNAGGTVLDLGCGPGHCAASMRDCGLKVDAIDASAEMVAAANAEYNIGARQALFTDIDGEQVYDAIWANFSLLHAPHEEFPGILSALHRALKPAGLFHIALKTGKGSKRDTIGRLYYYYSPEELTAHIEAAGFQIQASQTGELVGLTGDTEEWISVLSKT